jgi:sarcosine oxidase, subunit delta
MLRLPCPHCGVRDEEEFRFGHESQISPPAPDAVDAVWADYLFFRDNLKGTHVERWWHADGCGLWFTAIRDTMTHEVHGVYPAGSPPPDRPSAHEADLS